MRGIQLTIAANPFESQPLTRAKKAQSGGFRAKGGSVAPWLTLPATCAYSPLKRSMENVFPLYAVYQQIAGTRAWQAVADAQLSDGTSGGCSADHEPWFKHVMAGSGPALNALDEQATDLHAHLHSGLVDSC